MFDTIHMGRGDQRVHKTVTEHRAPTDESVRLLSEMEAAAEKRVIERGNTKCSNTNLEIRWTSIFEPYDPDIISFHLFYNLNGKERQLKVSACPSRIANPREKFKLIHEAVVKDVAETISINLLEKHQFIKRIQGQ